MALGINLKLIPLLFLVFLSFKTNAFVFYEDTRIWNQSEISFYFSDGTQKQKNEVKEFAKLWQKYTGIKFSYTNEKPGFFNFKKYYTITFTGKFNEANRGAINGTIHFGDLSDNIIYRKTTILHEFGHMLGLGHEHQRADRPDYLNDGSLLRDCMKNQKQSKKWCKNNLLNKYTSEVFVESAYDNDSIMHYEIDNILGIQSDTNNSNSLSYTDKYFIAMLYNQNISDKVLEKMHQQDLWMQKSFENKANKNREREIMRLSSKSCKPLQYPNKSKDGKYCENGFMVIDKQGYSFADEEFKSCHTSIENIQDKLDNHPLCQLSPTQLKQQRKQWRINFAEYGNCKRLETNIRNNQESYCKGGFSFVTKNNDLVGKKTKCYGSEESTYRAMQNNPVCAMEKYEFAVYKRQEKVKQNRKLKTKHCQVVKKNYQGVNCPTDFDYTIINLKNRDQPINNKCFASKHQAINAMSQIGICASS